MTVTRDHELAFDRPSPSLGPLSARLASIALVFVTVGAFVRPFWLSDWYGNDEVDRYPGRLELLHAHFSIFDPLPRWIPELAGGHGYPLFNFFNPGSLFVALPFRALGADPFTATKLALIVMLLVGGLHAMALGRRLWGEGAGALAAVLMLTAPYTVSNFYHRGDFAEGWANLLFPVVLYHYLALREGRRLGSFLALALAWGLLVPAHAFSALLFALAFSVLFSARALHHRLGHAAWHRGDGLVVLASTLGVGLAAIYWIPALGEKSSVRIDEFFSIDKLMASALDLGDLLDPTPEARLAAHRRLTLGAFLPALAGVALWTSRDRATPRRGLTFGLASGGLVALFMTTPLAEPVYEVVPLVGQILFPYRFLGLATFFFVCVAARATAWLSPGRRELAGLVLGALSLVLALPHLHHPGAVDFPAGHEDYVARASRELMLFDYGEYFPRAVIDVPPRARAPYESAGCEVEEVSLAPRRYELTLRSAAGCSVTVAQHIWLGWAAELNGTPTPLAWDHFGRMVVRSPAGEHALRVAWSPTGLQRTAGGVSLAALALWLGLLALWLARARRGMSVGAQLRWLAREVSAVPAGLASAQDALDARAFRALRERWGAEALEELTAAQRALVEHAEARDPALVGRGRRARRLTTAAVCLGLVGLAAYVAWPRPRLVASASGFLGGDPTFGAERAIDGLTTTAWYPPGEGGWLEVALLPPRGVSQIELVNSVGLDHAPRSTETFVLRLLAGGETVEEVQGRLEPGERWRHRFDAPMVDRIRFEVRSHRGAGGGLVELRVR
ncbi:MAG: hypothetical protein KF901_29585 [Myxococcales bacterium]|nr:hypothetical protein [Myxococcales bacterium]